MRFVSFAVLSSGLRNERKYGQNRKYEQKERPCSSLRNAIRSGFLAFAVYLPETATSELSVGDRSRLVVSPRRAHTKMRFVSFAVLSSGLRNERKYEQKERPCSSIRNAIRSGFLAFAVYFPDTATIELSVGDRSRLVVSPRRAHTKMRFVPFAVLSSGLRNDRKYEQKERPCSSIRNAIRSGFLAFAVYLPETATSELSVGDRSRLVVSPRRAHTKMRFVPFAVLSSGLRNDRKYEQKERPLQLYPECNPFRFSGLCGLFTGNSNKRAQCR